MARPSLASWLIVVLCFIAMSVSFSTRSALSPVMPYLEADLGWSRTFVSSGYSLAHILLAAASPVFGNLIDRFGPRHILGGGLAVLGAGAFLTAGVTAPWQYLLAYGVVGGIGFGIIATHLVSTIVSREFVERRGLAIGIATSGATVGQLIIIPQVARLLQATEDWRLVYIVLGGLCLAVIPFVYLLIRGRPSAATIARLAEPVEPIGARLGFLARQPVFHLLGWSYFVCGVTTSGVIEAHLVPYAVFCGYAPVEGADAFGLLMAINFGGMVLAGWLSDRMSRPLLLGSIYLLRACTFILLMFVAGDIKLLYLFAILFGLFDYSTVPVTASLAASHLGIRIMGLSMGLLSAAHALGGAAGAYMAGYLFDMFGRYQWTWAVAFVTAVIAAFLCYAIRENRPTRRLAAATA